MGHAVSFKIFTDDGVAHIVSLMQLGEPLAITGVLDGITETLSTCHVSGDGCTLRCNGITVALKGRRVSVWYDELNGEVSQDAAQAFVKFTMECQLPPLTD